MSVKTTRPRLTGAVQRERLFRLLDAGAERPVTWLAAPGGAGKSTLVASYLDARQLPCLWYQCDQGDADLATFFHHVGQAARKSAPRFKKPLPLLTPEYLAGVPTFTRHYFEELCRRVKTIVLDNYQDIPADSAFHVMLANGLDVLPPGVRVLILSRGEPPTALFRLQVSDAIFPLRDSDLRLTFDESRQLIQLRNPELDEQSVQAIHEKTAGWVAGIILMLERGKFDGAVTEAARERLFAYFAGEIFSKATPEVQTFLLKTAYLKTFSVEQAERLTGYAGAGKLLEMLNRHHYFTERLAGSGLHYQYHPLFSEFLHHSAFSVFDSADLMTLQSDAALMLEDSGQLEDAARLYAAAQNSASLARMVIQYARKLLLQGRNKTVAEWLQGLPAAVAAADPWLLYWTGMCSFPFDIPRSRQFFEKSFDLFKSKADAAGVYLAWTGIVDTYGFALDEWRRLDEWIEAFAALKQEFPAFPSEEIDLLVSSRMLMALTLRRIDQAQRVQEWRDHVTALLQENPSLAIQIDIVFFMSVYHLWKGEYGKNAVLLERAEAELDQRKPTPFAVIRIKLMLGIHYWVTADYAAAFKILSAGLEIARESGVHLYDSLLWGFRAAAEMAQGNVAIAGELLQKERSSLLGMAKTLDIYFFHINSAWHALLTGNPALAIENLQLIAAKVEKMGTPYYRALWNIGMAQALSLQARTPEARAYVQGAQQLGLEMQSPVIEWYSLLIGAYLDVKEGREEEALRSLRNGLALGRRYGYVHLQFYQPSVMQLLFARALAAGIEPEYVSGLIRKLSLPPPSGGKSASATALLDSWPYPVKITTLGRFEIRIDGQPLAFAGKEQKKPLELFKVLIASGGREVPMERLTDVLWPEADGDLAQKSLETTLARLRRLLGNDEAICCRGRLVSVNNQICRVDSLVLGELLDGLAQAPPERSAALCARAVALHQGPFLATDGALPWAMTRREALRNGLLRALLKTGKQLEAAGAWEQAADCYARGIETDPLAEECHRRLMTCQRQLGNHAEVVTLYRRCRALLRAELGIEPSPETTAVYAAIVTPA